MRAESPLPLRVYDVIARYPGPVAARWLLRRRAARGKEDAGRIAERFGQASLPRPPGALVWLHAASVGEALSLLPLIDQLQHARPDLALLTTTGTRTSAQVMADRLPPGALHQYAPIDTAPAVSAFLSHWRPDFLGVAESELWPTLLRETSRRDVPIALLSARMSERSARGWRRAPRTAAALLRLFDLLLPQTEAIGARLRALGAPPERIRVLGSLKSDAAPLPSEPAEVAAVRAAIGARPVWLAASTHDGEETAAIAAHQAWAKTRPGALVLIAPRHPERADEVVAVIRAAGLRVARRSEAPVPTAEVDAFVIDTLGELGLWYRVAPLVFVGGSLVPVGGHNPFEPARLGAAICFGPHVEAFADECAALLACRGARRVDDVDGLAAALSELSEADGRPTLTARDMAKRAGEVAEAASGVARRTYDAIAPLLPAPLVERRAPAETRATPGGDDAAA